MNNYTFEDGTDNMSDDETEYGDIMYEPEELTLTKNNIVICEKYNELIHGVSDNEMNYHFLTIFRFKQLEMNIINSFIITSNINSRIEIAECIYLPSEHCISIIKTYWLRLIQRNWKRIIKERSICLIRRCNRNAINHREIYGKWPNECLNYPSLRGMLSSLY